jgi:uncharacterized protein (TIGR00299 family) protein
MTRVLHLDCLAGISGDMALGALIDAGADPGAIRASLAALALEPFELTVGDVDAAGIRSVRVEVRTEAAAAERPWREIDAALERSDLRPRPTDLARRVFRVLAEAEGRAHGTEPEDVTFHEVGAVDSIVDVVGTAVALDLLGVERVTASAVPLGRGWVETRAGRLPVPGPAVLELLRGVPLRSLDVEAELVTPTGAAILAALAESYGDVPPMTLEAVGYGAGSHHLGFPNVLRVLVGKAEPARDAASVRTDVLLETNLDDLNPELFPHVLERVFAAGAVDVWLTPVVMKKGRPGVVLAALCPPGGETAVRDAVFRETGTLGIRTRPVTRHVLDREMLKVETPWGPVGVKVGRLHGEATSAAPEYEDVARVAREAGLPAKQVYEETLRLARSALADGALRPG